MRKKECVAMLLAGGQGSRLGYLTRNIAKPAVPFGGKYRIIDFSLSNCTNSRIDTVGVLTQYKPLLLNAYIGNGSSWDLNLMHGGVYILSPYVGDSGCIWYRGTADAVYQNGNFVDQFDAEYLLVLSGDHIYKMDYSKMLSLHKDRGADLTISVIEVPEEEASRFGIALTDENGRITGFQEKPEKPLGRKASMGIYIFSWKVLKKYLEKDSRNMKSEHDFGKNIISAMLEDGKKIYAYKYKGYWKDVGTVASYYRANMDLLEENPEFRLDDRSGMRIYSNNSNFPAHYTGPSAKIRKSLVSDGAFVLGNVSNSVIFPGVYIDEKATVRNSIIMPNVKIGENAKIFHAVIGERTTIGENAVIGKRNIRENFREIAEDEITVIGDNLEILPGEKICSPERFKEWFEGRSTITA